MMTETATIGYLEFPVGDRVRVYARPVEVITATRVEDVLPALHRIQDLVDSGLHAGGFVAYEAAAAFDPAFQTYPPADIPLLCFGIYSEFTWRSKPPQTLPLGSEGPEWLASVSREAYDTTVAAIRAQIAAGNTYQVNYTFPTEADFGQTGYNWFLDRHQAQQGPYSAFQQWGDHEIISLSPELFFSLEGDQLTSRPMKGTRPRGLSARADQQLRKELLQSPKERAENLMIVDMIRNDMGRICETGTIQVPNLFSAEQYPTVWQMTSTITGKTQASVPEIFQALFPCASVTGAPKIETMKLIRQFEKGPRGVYCGAVGWWAPNRSACFNVAIRTATVNSRQSTATYPVGSGITWDSVDHQEYAECNTKTAVLQHGHPPFELLASLRLDETGYLLLPLHLDRLAASAGYFGVAWCRDSVIAALESYRSDVAHFPAKVRLTVARTGEITISHAPLPTPAAWNVGLAADPIDTRQPWVHHKTTHRLHYDQLRATRPDCTDVVLWDQEHRLTEASFANIVLEIEGKRYTPPAHIGLLEGVFRRHLLETGAIEERVLYVSDLERADSIYLINSVRTWIPVNWVAHHADRPLVEHTR